MVSGGLDLDACEALAERVARDAGATIRSAIGKQKVKQTKTSHADLVTETDQECERIIVRTIRETFPGHKFIGEEEVSETGVMPELTDDPTWMIDPVDGTTNFVHGFPFVCVCIGLCVEKRPVLGVVYNPVLGELFVAREGRGATLNGARIGVSGTADLKSAVFATEIGTVRDAATMDATYGRVSALTRETRSVRMCGSCACNMTGVACGRLDGFYELGFGGPWDVAAAACIVLEAGGVVMDPSGGPFNVMSRRVLCANGDGIGRALAAVLGRIPPGPEDPPPLALLG